MKPNTLRMSASDETPRSRISVAEPVWSDVEMRIERAFQYGGKVKLEALEQDPEQGYALFVKESIDMEALHGGFRIIVNPGKKLGQKTNLREWWEPEDRPFRGTDRFGDDEWDSRTVCTDISVAKQMFMEFFDGRGITEAITNQTLSVWDRKPR